MPIGMSSFLYARYEFQLTGTSPKRNLIVLITWDRLHRGGWGNKPKVGGMRFYKRLPPTGMLFAVFEVDETKHRFSCACGYSIPGLWKP